MLPSNVDNNRTSPSVDELWAYFDRIFCISLEDRPDRRQSALDQFRKIGLADRVEFVIVNKHPTNSEQGIFESHMRCIRMGIKAAAQTILIFEDDVVFDRFNTCVLEECIRFLSSEISWNIFFLGCLADASQKTEYGSVLKVRYRGLSHAYVIDRNFAESLTGQIWNNTPFDTMLRKLSPHYYAVYPAFAFQSNARTDNMRLLKRDRMRRLFGGLKRIQKLNEWYLRHRSVVIGIHIFLILILLILVAAY